MEKLLWFANWQSLMTDMRIFYEFPEIAVNMHYNYKKSEGRNAEEFEQCAENHSQSLQLLFSIPFYLCFLVSSGSHCTQ